MPEAVLYVMPVYNAAPWLRAAVRSVLEQSWPALSLLCIDDGSRDGSYELLQQLAAEDPRMAVRRQANAGPGLVMNTALAEAQARGVRYIARMDADDLCTPERTALQMAYLEAHPTCAACGCQAGYLTDTRPDAGRSPVHTDPERIRAELLGGGRGLVQGGTIFRVEALVAVGGWRPVHTPAEDVDLFLRLAERYDLGNIPERCYGIRIHHDSYSLRSLLGTRRYNGYYIQLARQRAAGQGETPYTAYEAAIGRWRRLDDRRITAAVGAYYQWVIDRSFPHLVLACLLDPWRLVNRLRKRRSA